jgi:hypothetical protein
MHALTRDTFALFIEPVVKKQLRESLRFVPEEITDWQDRDFIAVMNRSRSEGVLVIEYPHAHTVPFQLQRRTPNAIGRIEAVICDICATWQRGTDSAVIMFRRDRSSISFLCCADLLCSLHVRGKTVAAVRSRTQLREDIQLPERIGRLRLRLHEMVKNTSI